MESSSQQALEIGLNVFIFVIALTCAILLLTSVLNISEAANAIIKDTTGSTLLELYGENDERKYSGVEVLAVISKYFSETSNFNDKYIIYIDKSGVGIEEVVTKNFNLEDINSDYYLKYKGNDGNGKAKYTFEKII